MLLDKILIRAFSLCELRALARNLLLAVLVAAREPEPHRKGAKDAKENSQGSNLQPDLPLLNEKSADQGAHGEATIYLNVPRWLVHRADVQNR